MILANVQIAKFMVDKLPDRAFLRLHPLPDEEEMENFKKYCNNFGVSIDPSTSLSLSQSMDKISNDDIPFLKELIEFQLKQAIRPAKYCVTGDDTIKDFQHYALSEKLYTHFTSPIRRYPDIMVHRVVDAILTDKIHELQPLSEMIEIAMSCNKKNLYLAKFKTIPKILSFRSTSKVIQQFIKIV